MFCVNDVDLDVQQESPRIRDIIHDDRFRDSPLTPVQQETYDHVCNLTVREYAEWLALDYQTGECHIQAQPKKPIMPNSKGDHARIIGIINQAVEEYERSKHESMESIPLPA